MLTKIALNKLTQAVTNRILTEARAYNQKLIESVTEEDLYEQFCIGTDVPPSKVDKGWQHLKTKYPPVFTELLSCLRDERKMDRLDYPSSYTLHEIVRPEVERLTVSLDEYDSDSLLAEQLFEKIYPMLVDAKYIHFESEKHEPTFELTQPTEEFQTAYKHYGQVEEEVKNVEEFFEAPFASPALEEEWASESKMDYDEGDWN